MILRSIRLVHFAGVPDMALNDLPERGAVVPPLPADAPPGLLADALRFAFLGLNERPETVISSDAGFAFVEVAFRLGAESDVSIFRGVDRRGAVQASLREAGGARVTGGVAEVRARLQELVGCPQGRWEYATWIERRSAPVDAATGTGGPRSLEECARRASLGATTSADPRSATPASPRSVERSRERAERAIDALRRSLRAAILRGRIEADVAALRDFGARLRRERIDVDLVLGRRSADGEAVRARLRRMDDDRDSSAQDGSDADGRRPGLESAPRTRRDDSRSDAASPDLSRRRSADPGGAGHDQELVAELRTHLSALDEETTSLRRRLELVDDSIAAFETEVLRCGRAIEDRASNGAPAAGGLSTEERRQDPRTRIARLGDAAYHAAVERDALLAVGAGSVESAVAALRNACQTLGEALGDPRRTLAAVDQAGLPAVADLDVARLVRDERVCARLVDALDAACRPRSGVGRGIKAPATSGVRDATSHAGEDVARLLSDSIQAITGGRFVRVEVRGRVELRLQMPGGPRPLGWDDLTIDVRERLALALRLRLAEEALDAACAASRPRHVVLESRPERFADDAAIVDFVRSVAPRVTQIVIPRRSERAS